MPVSLQRDYASSIYKIRQHNSFFITSEKQGISWLFSGTKAPITCWDYRRVRFAHAQSTFVSFRPCSAGRNGLREGLRLCLASAMQPHLFIHSIQNDQIEIIRICILYLYSHITFHCTRYVNLFLVCKFLLEFTLMVDLSCII